MTATIDHVAVPSGDPERAAGALVERLGASGLAYGNDPEHPDNGQTADPLGGPGRVYFVSPDGHLFEVTVRS